MLVKNNIVESISGMSGGFVLKKTVSELHLQEIYCTIEDRQAFYLNVKKNYGSKYEEQLKLNNFFLDLFIEIQIDIENKMKTITVDSILKKINKQ